MTMPFATDTSSEYALSIASAYARFNTKGIREEGNDKRTPNPDYCPAMARFVMQRWPEIVTTYIYEKNAITEKDVSNHDTSPSREWNSIRK